MTNKKIIFVSYVDLDKDYYTINEICDMLDLDKHFLHAACEESGIRPAELLRRASDQATDYFNMSPQTLSVS